MLFVSNVKEVRLKKNQMAFRDNREKAREEQAKNQQLEQ